MNSLPVIETKRLRLRMPSAKDISEIVEYANHPQIAKMTLSFPYPYQEKNAVAWLNIANQGFENEDHFIFAICNRAKDQFMGAIGLNLNKRFNNAELGFWLGEPFWKNGYATEATGKILKFGFERLKLQKIYAIHMINNPASGKVMINNGMIKEGELVDHIKKEDQYYTVLQYRLTREEYVAL